MERLDRLRLSSVAYARYAPSSSRAFHGKDTSRISPIPLFRWPASCHRCLRDR
ncbi:MAG: hypothetical protein KTR25_02195 [Myxococcales bacterium]|nr:hypothetical protein [Myxococcales bacterium]